ncbi:hypothetical protein J2Y45_001512 [Dyadobacter sp. BE34]|uniref:Uncharacterized protein n=1 Tax=Dyadobacter fermentans TaxID=94254 RepID=A0ABU1QSW2_9BACT|nr:hypothetical protein [Dyadobacter fermentans]MDR7041983.1 hypothetical protein [Dyadobacter sp. BE242]MDR7196386.1 hypothetical protein [Dyadobacter sp. BE34]MDR7213069.1 hypothetical protein [Dyadobacter sp. BE31]MDR7261792.1 hypothetical protein [Dyadobacter sp. BE32]
MLLLDEAVENFDLFTRLFCYIHIAVDRTSTLRFDKQINGLDAVKVWNDYCCYH